MYTPTHHNVNKPMHKFKFQLTCVISVVSFRNNKVTNRYASLSAPYVTMIILLFLCACMCFPALFLTLSLSCISLPLFSLSLALSFTHIRIISSSPSFKALRVVFREKGERR